MVVQMAQPLIRCAAKESNLQPSGANASQSQAIAPEINDLPWFYPVIGPHKKADPLLKLQTTREHPSESSVSRRTHAGRRVLFPAEGSSVTVYGLVDPREPRRVRYAGITQEPKRRYLEHLAAPSIRVLRWVHSLRVEHISPIMVELEVVPELNAGYREGRWIARLGRIGMADLNAENCRASRLARGAP